MTADGGGVTAHEAAVMRNPIDDDQYAGRDKRAGAWEGAGTGVSLPIGSGRPTIGLCSIHGRPSNHEAPPAVF
jgi:hypothetical protein